MRRVRSGGRAGVVFSIVLVALPLGARQEGPLQGRCRADRELAEAVRVHERAREEEEEAVSKAIQVKMATDCFSLDSPEAAAALALEAKARRAAEATSAAAAQVALKREAVRRAAGKAAVERAWLAWRDLQRATGVRLASEKTLAAAPRDQGAGLLKSLAAATANERAARAAFRVAEQSMYGGLKPLPPEAWTLDKARHLLHRAGFGGTWAEVERLHRLGIHGAVEVMVDGHGPPDPAPAFAAASPERAWPGEEWLGAAERSELAGARADRDREQVVALREDWIRRLCLGARPLREKMALFWHGHFATRHSDVGNALMVQRQHDLFRGREADNFGTLLAAMSRDPALIRSLDNHRNFKGAGNENLGREILELFTMGEGRGYTEEDLRDASRALTGYSVDPVSGRFKFLADRHDGSVKTIFGSRGPWGGDELVDLILRQPATAAFISGKLFRFFVHDSPNEADLLALGELFRRAGYELAPLLRNLFLSEEFYGEGSVGRRIKSPAELLVGTARTMGLRAPDAGLIDQGMQAMGMTLFEPPGAQGWEGGAAWIDASRILARYNGACRILEGAGAAVFDELSALGAFKTDAAADHVLRTCLATPLPEPKRQRLVAVLGTLPPPADWPGMRADLEGRLRSFLALVVSLPEYQVN